VRCISLIAREPQTLTHAERVRGDALLRARRQAHSLERTGNARPRAATAYGGVHFEVLHPRQVAVKARLVDDRADPRERPLAFVRDAEAKHGHGPRRQPREPEQQSNDGCLAGAVGAQKAEGDSARDLEVHTLERLTLAEALRQAGGLDGRRPAAARCVVHGGDATPHGSRSIGREAGMS